MNRFCVCTITLLVSVNSYATDVLRGVIRDANTKEELVGATVVVKGNAQKGAIPGLDGSFIL